MRMVTYMVRVDCGECFLEVMGGLGKHEVGKVSGTKVSRFIMESTSSGVRCLYSHPGSAPYWLCKPEQVP